MPSYRLKFQIFGKRMMTSVDAPDPEAAKRKVMDKLIFDEVERIPQPFDTLQDDLNDLMDKMGYKPKK